MRKNIVVWNNRLDESTTSPPEISPLDELMDRLLKSQCYLVNASKHYLNLSVKYVEVSLAPAFGFGPVIKLVCEDNAVYFTEDDPEEFLKNEDFINCKGRNKAEYLKQHVSRNVTIIDLEDDL